MPRQPSVSVENHFVGGLKTEFTALNFPENACTDTDNCVFSVLGDVNRRPGINYENNFIPSNFVRTNKAMSSFIWTNAGGDGNTKIYVQQVGQFLFFYNITTTTTAIPLSRNRIFTFIDTSAFQVSNQDSSQIECQYAEGNGYLLVFNSFCDPFYLTYSAGVITGSLINISIRDTIGINEPGVPDSFRPPALSQEHFYNLLNQGWTNATGWTASSTSTVTLSTGNHTFTVAAGLTIIPGDSTTLTSTDNTGFGSTSVFANGIVTSYSGTSLVINITSFSGTTVVLTGSNWSISKAGGALINAWQSSVGNNPSNSDQWWNFKDNTGVFNPTVTYPNTVLNQAPAPKGSLIIPAFFQRRSNISGLNVNDTITFIRPKTGTWFQGRVWYAGVDDSSVTIGDAPHYSWSENIYFSQIVQSPSQFGKCYQTNDPTSENLFDLLASDGGVITIQGCGSIYKLFPIQNGLLVFATNGIWFITGSQGIGFSATDYTITKISSVQSISSTSFVNVLGFPMFWNTEGIYTVTPSQQGGGLEVNNLCIGTIASYYATIPDLSKRFVRGDYDPLNYEIKWIFKSTFETNLTDRYSFDRVLNFNTASKAFYPYSIDNSFNTINDVKYIAPTISGIFPGIMKYTSSYPSVVGGGVYSFTFAEENDFTNWVDFFSYNNVGIDYNSFFTTGYKLRGQAQRKWQPGYVYMYQNTEVPTAYKIQGIWDFASNSNSGKYSSEQLVTTGLTRFNNGYRRIKIRGNGVSLQIKVSSATGLPFNILGWSMFETQNAGV